MSQRRLIFRVHALRRMFERSITEIDVREVLENGDVIEKYPDELPYPTRLMLGFCDDRPIHVVLAEVPQSQESIIITVYEPDPRRWDSTFRSRRQS